MCPNSNQSANQQATSLRKVVERLQEIDRVANEFITNVSCELRTPTLSILGYADLMLQGLDGPLNEQQRTHVTAIHRNGQRLLGLINEFLDRAKLGAGWLELDIEEVDLNQLIETVTSATLEYIENSPTKPELEQNVPYDLPTIWADGLRVRQAMVEILSEAVKSISHSEGKITLAASYDDDWVTLRVADNRVVFRDCCGNDHPALFTSQSIVEIHGGQMHVEAQKDVGTVVTFTLPIHQNKPSQ